MIGDYKMKKIILSTMLAFASVSLMASENASASKSGAFSSKTIDGAGLYKQRCSVCHGVKAKKTPLKNMLPIAGMDATILARITRAYRDQDESHGTAHNIYRENQMMKEATNGLSNQQIGAIAKHINGLIK